MASLVFLIFFLGFSIAATEDNQDNIPSPCFQFNQINGTGFASFMDGLPIEYSAHFQIEIHTESDGGLIYYAEASRLPHSAIDFEIVYLKDGYVFYLIFNPSVHGTGDTFGFHANSSQRLNDNTWHTVEFYRNREVERTDAFGKTFTVTETGLIVDGNQEDNSLRVSQGARHGFQISEPLFIGGNPSLEHRTSKAVAGFKGKIRGFKEMSGEHIHVFRKTHAENEAKKCIDDSIPDPL